MIYMMLGTNCKIGLIIRNRELAANTQFVRARLLEMRETEELWDHAVSQEDSDLLGILNTGTKDVVSLTY